MTALRHLAAASAVLLLAGCGQDPTGAGSKSIAAAYRLTEVDGQTPPCCAQIDSAGTSVTILGGTLLLGPAPAGTYVITPGGPMSGSCVHEIPDGAYLDAANNVVHMPDGSTYAVPPCGDGPYTLMLTRRYQFADGTSRTATDTTSGLYTWGSDGATTRLTLVGAELGGAVLGFPPGGLLRIGTLHPWMNVQPGHEYIFSSAQD